MKLFKRTPIPADDLGYGIFINAIKVLLSIIGLAYGLLQLALYFLE